MISYKEIFENNKKWMETKKSGNADYFTELAKGQKPDYLYIGCSDSRVTAEDLMGAKPGEIFVHRNIANVVSNTDLNAMSVVEYAVGHLKVPHIVICGHYFCGGVAAAMEAQDLGLLNPWLRNIRDVYRLHQEKLDKIEDDTERYKRLVELNVEEQCVNLIKTAVFQKAYADREKPEVHGWVFDIESGKLIDLEIDFRSKIKEFQKIYSLGLSN